jgi:hypothetical protein
MNLLKSVLCVLCLSLVSCAEMGLKPHKPNIKSSIEIGKSNGTFRVLSVKANSAAVAKVLSGDLITCGTTTFSMPRGNNVESFIREIFVEELRAAQKLSSSGSAIEVVIKSMDLKTFKPEAGEWTMDIDYIVDGKTTNVKNAIEFESKVSILTSCSHTASVFEDALADSFVEFFKRTR